MNCDCEPVRASQQIPHACRLARCLYRPCTVQPFFPLILFILRSWQTIALFVGKTMTLQHIQKDRGQAEVTHSSVSVSPPVHSIQVPLVWLFVWIPGWCAPWALAVLCGMLALLLLSTGVWYLLPILPLPPPCHPSQASLTTTGLSSY